MEVATVTVPFACGRQLRWADVVPHLKSLKDERARQLTHVLVQEKGAHPRDPPTVRGVASRDSRELEWLENATATVVAPAPVAPAPVVPWNPQLWHLRPGARQALPTDLGRAHTALEALLRQWARLDDPASLSPHHARLAEGFWWLALVVQMHHLRLRERKLEALCQALARRHARWLDVLLLQAPLSQHVERLLEPRPLRRLADTEVTRGLESEFPADFGDWRECAMEEAWPLVALRRGVLREGRVQAPFRLLGPLVVRTRAARLVERILQPWPSPHPALRSDPRLSEFYRYWLPRVVGVVEPSLGRPGPSVSADTLWDGQAESLPPCLRRAVHLVRQPEGLRNATRTVLWSALVATGCQRVEDLEDLALPADPHRRRDARGEWQYWTRKQAMQREHKGPSCRTVAAAGLCAFEGRCATCVQQYAAPGSSLPRTAVPHHPSRMYRLHRTVVLANEACL